MLTATMGCEDGATADRRDSGEQSVEVSGDRPASGIEGSDILCLWGVSA